MAKLDLAFDPPVMNAAGSLGFAPDKHLQLDWSKLGAFITNPVSASSRTPAHGQRFMAYSGGFLLHTGYPNPGISQVIRKFHRQWEMSRVPIIVHLLGQCQSELELMSRKLENVDGVSGLEVGLAGDVDGEIAATLIKAASGELPVIARLPMERALELASMAIHAGALAVSLAPPRGMLPVQPEQVVQGRLYGPSVFPMALRIVTELGKSDIPMIAAGGIYSREQVKTMLDAGATAVQLDSVLWRGAGYIF